MTSNSNPTSTNNTLQQEAEAPPAVVSGSVAKSSYRDYSTENEKGQALDESFPTKLHFMLADLERDGHDFIVAWHVHGRCFSVRRQPLFVKHVMPCYFRQSKFPSFQRQLNLYGFKRITSGPDKGAYYHECFLRGKPFLASRIQRQRIKGTGSRKPAIPEQEPDFHSMPFLPPSDMAKYKAAAAAQASEVTAAVSRAASGLPVTPRRSLLGLPVPTSEEVLGLPASGDVLSLLCRTRVPVVPASPVATVTPPQLSASLSGGLSAASSPLTAIMATKLSAAKSAAAAAAAVTPRSSLVLAMPDASSLLPPTSPMLAQRLSATTSTDLALATYDRALAAATSSRIRSLVNRSLASTTAGTSAALAATSPFTQTNSFFRG